MAHGISPASRKKGAYGEHQLGVALDVLDDYSSFNNYNLWIPGPAFVDASAATTIRADASGFVTRVFPAGKTNTTVFAFRRPRQWVLGKLSGRIWWTGDDPASTGARLMFGFNATAEDDTFSNPTIAEVTVPLGTFTIYTLKVIRDVNIATTIFVDQTHSLISVSFGRDGVSGLDTYAGDFELLGIEVYYTELRSDAGYRINPDFKNVSMP